jgi:ABC-type transport system involved in cytochrome bd biosynthesis fused ATPase/permease subunit
LDQYGLEDLPYWILIDMSILVAFYLVFCLITYLSLQYIHWNTRPPMQVATADAEGILENKPNYGVVNSASQDHLNITSGSHLAFKNLSYTVTVDSTPLKKLLRREEKKQLLHEVNGYIPPGCMCALMGSSGAGKSTLLDVLAGRKTGGKIEGEILINGKLKDKFFPRVTGYVEQFNVFIPSLTVRETLEYSANMRLDGSLPSVVKSKRVDDVLQMIELTHIQHRIVGDPDTGISPEQR